MSDDLFEKDDAWTELAFGALDHAVGSISDSEGPLVPFVMKVTTAGEQTLTRFFSGEDYQGDVDRAKAEAPKQARAWAVAWDGYITLPDSGRTEAVFVETVGGSLTKRLLFAWRYARDSGGKLQTIGNPALIQVDVV